MPVLQPMNNREKTTELSPQEQQHLCQLFDDYDVDGSGTLPWDEVSATSFLGGFPIEAETLEHADENFVTFQELLHHWYPNINRKDTERYCAATLTPGDLFHLKNTFYRLTEQRATLTMQDVVESGYCINGMRFSARMFNNNLNTTLGLSFLEMLIALYPRIPVAVLQCHAAVDLKPADVHAIKAQFERLDLERKGCLSKKEFDERSALKTIRNLQDRKAFQQSTWRTLLGQKYNLQFFNRLDAKRTGQLTFSELMSSLYLSISPWEVEQYINIYLHGVNPNQFVLPLSVEQEAATQITDAPPTPNSKKETIAAERTGQLPLLPVSPRYTAVAVQQSPRTSKLKRQHHSSSSIVGTPRTPAKSDNQAASTEVVNFAQVVSGSYATMGAVESQLLDALDSASALSVGDEGMPNSASQQQLLLGEHSVIASLQLEAQQLRLKLFRMKQDKDAEIETLKQKLAEEKQKFKEKEKKEQEEKVVHSSSKYDLRAKKKPPTDGVSTVQSSASIIQQMLLLEALQPVADNIRTFMFDHENDQNGLIYFLGSLGGKNQWRNPFWNGLVILTGHVLDATSLAVVTSRPGKEKLDLCDNPLPLFVNPKDRWFCIDLGVQIHPTHYTLSTLPTPTPIGESFAVSWTLHGSNNQEDWDLLSSHADDTSLCSSDATKTWTLKASKAYQFYKVTIEKVLKLESNMQTRVRQVLRSLPPHIDDVPASLSHEVLLPVYGFEVYGMCNNIAHQLLNQIVQQPTTEQSA
eukprot:TRINITY_DN17867_c0_g1_i1.p1 TRINITY_DN17867_c0_g1~~TRINITY_DN17867_c0_g1_i1.p1  ORF type:complete len:762 (+),score=89.94 TRINITY_DN17867_c0_g1_i1:36-2288(+)